MTERRPYLGAAQPQRKDRARVPEPGHVLAAVRAHRHGDLGTAALSLQPALGRQGLAVIVRAAIRAYAARVDDTLLGSLLSLVAQQGDPAVVSAASRLVAGRICEGSR